MKTLISKILEVLDDGEWHSIGELRRKTQLSLEDLKRVIDFLVKYDFIVIDERGGKVRLSEVFLRTLSHEPL